jgi:hypothetical protein
MELERDFQLPFLDVQDIQCLDNSLEYAMHRKAASKDRYIEAASQHPPSHKRSIITTLMDRANSIYEKGSWTSELHVKFIL